jgi:flagellar biosynthesis/type III secretory pathway protein FliH
MPRYPQYMSNAERQKAYRERRKQEEAERHAENVTLRDLVGASGDTVLAEATDALTQAELAADPFSGEATTAAFAAGRQEGYAEGYQEGYAACAMARLADLIEVYKPKP